MSLHIYATKVDDVRLLLLLKEDSDGLNLGNVVNWFMEGGFLYS